MSTGWDSNPRRGLRLTVLQTVPFGHSGTCALSPYFKAASSFRSSVILRVCSGTLISLTSDVFLVSALVNSVSISWIRSVNRLRFLSIFAISRSEVEFNHRGRGCNPAPFLLGHPTLCGAHGIRTRHLLHAMQVLCQMSYHPWCSLSRCHNRITGPRDRPRPHLSILVHVLLLIHVRRCPQDSNLQPLYTQRVFGHLNYNTVSMVGFEPTLCLRNIPKFSHS